MALTERPVRDIIGTAEAAKLIGVCGARIRQLVRDGDLRPLGMVNRGHVFDVGQVAALKTARALRGAGR